MVLTRLSLPLSIVTVLFTLLPALVGAEWKIFYQTDEGQKKYYFDQESVTRPDTRTVHVRYKVMDAKDENNEVELSSALIELSCKPKAYKILEETKSDDNNKEPVNVIILRHSIALDSVMGTLWTNLCP